MDGIQLALIIELWKLITGNNIGQSSQNLYPRHYGRKSKIRSNAKGIQTSLWESNRFRTGACFIYREKSTDISTLKSERRKFITVSAARNRKKKRTEQSGGKKNLCKVKPLREDLKTAQSSPSGIHILKLLETECYGNTIKAKTERNYERWKHTRKILQ